MRFARHADPSRLLSMRHGSVVTIGAYDGLHMGHQALLQATLREAAENDLASIVLSFEPTPREFFAGESAPARLMRFREKYLMLEAMGIDLFFCPRFDQQLADKGPDAFAKSLLAGALNARVVVVGDDFRYASRRSGNLSTLAASGAELDFEVRAIAGVELEGRRVSSTSIREALAVGDLDLAARMLGRDFSMSGRVNRGKQLGRTLGYATANIAVARRVSPLHGIYAVRVSGGGVQKWPAVASIGTRPSVDDGMILLEVHLFDFDANLYGRELSVDFVKFLRPEEKFATLDLLVQQMHLDSAMAKDVLGVKGMHSD